MRTASKTPWRTLPDGREIISKTPAGKREYKCRVADMWIRDFGICCLCGGFVPLESSTFEHKVSRGMGGGKRDDRIEFNGVSHAFGNRAKASVSYEIYMRLPLEVRIRNCKGVYL